uniref:Putative ABC transporter, periplasmic domain n=1 Tax=Magnetococcus massalia (strain MO-1) TaxID=451514 RepID=A0A1S7LET0_MAGMO|nr:putative ABC transporter, periplasmic domain [Candidatus Magnetococcus massalia]
MRRSVWKSIWLGCLAILAVAVTPAKAVEKPLLDQDVITLVADEWCPYNCAENAQMPGYLVEIARAAFAFKGRKVEYKVMPWSRALKLVNINYIHGALGAVPEEAPYLHYPRLSLGFSEDVFLTQKANNWRFEGPRSLLGMHIGLTKDYFYGEMLETVFRRPQVRLTYVGGENTQNQLTLLLMADQIDAFIEDTNVIRHAARQMGMEKELRWAGQSGEQVSISIGFQPTALGKQLSQELDEGLERLRESGELARILKRYGLKDWQKTWP